MKRISFWIALAGLLAISPHHVWGAKNQPSTQTHTTPATSACSCTTCGCTSCNCETKKSWIDNFSEVQVIGTAYGTSEYVFRGKKQAQTSIQPSLTLAIPLLTGQLYAKAWMNVPTQNKRIAVSTSCPHVHTHTGNEVDFTLGYQVPLSMPADDLFPASEGVLTIDVGYTYYYYPTHSAYFSFKQHGKTFGQGYANEIYVGLRGNVITKPSLYTYYDFNREQWVFQGSISHSFELGELFDEAHFMKPISFDIGAYIGYLVAHDYMGDQARNSYNRHAGSHKPHYPKWHNSYFFGGMTADLVYRFSDHARASIGIRYAGNNDGDSGFGPGHCIRPSIGGYEDLFWWTAGIDCSF